MSNPIAEDLLAAGITAEPPAKMTANRSLIRGEAITSQDVTIGIKHDADKPRMGLLPGDALRDVATVMTFGANKYSADNWKQVEPARFTHALFRHLSAYIDGEVFDQETELPHMAHIATNALFLLHLSRDQVCR